MLLGQRQEPLQDAQAFSASLPVKGFGPGARSWPQESAALQDPLGAPFDQRAFMIMDVGRIGLELSRFLSHMHGDGFHAVVEHTNDFGLPARPDSPAHILRRHGVIRLVDFDVPIAVNFARRFAEDWKQAGRQRQELGLFDAQKMRAHLLARGAVNARVGHGLLPVSQMQILSAQARERFAGQSVALNIFDPGLDLTFMAGHRRFGREDHRPVMFTERHDLGIEFGLEPIDLLDGCPQIVDDQGPDDPTKVPQSIL